MTESETVADYYQNPQHDPYQSAPPPRSSKDTPEVDGRRLWISGIVTGVIAALANIVTLAIAREVLDIPVFVPESPGSDTLTELSFALTALVSFIAAILATGLLHILLKTVPSPRTFFSWIVFLVWAGSLVPALASGATIANKVVLVIMHTLVALIVGGTLNAVSRRTSTAL